MQEVREWDGMLKTDKLRHVFEGGSVQRPGLAKNCKRNLGKSSYFFEGALRHHYVIVQVYLATRACHY